MRAEIRRQLRRRRTQGIFGVITALPLILVLAFWIGDDDDTSGARGFVDLAQDSGANLTVFALFAATGFLLIVVVALFAGDTVPSEASWSSLRYLLAAPVRRTRLLRQKLIVAALSSVVALIFLPAWTLLVGGIAYGWGAYVGPTGDQLALGTFVVRLLIIVGYLCVQLATVAAFAFALGVVTDAPLGRGRRSGAADDPVGHPRFDHRARRICARVCPGTTPSPGPTRWPRPSTGPTWRPGRCGRSATRSC